MRRKWLFVNRILLYGLIALGIIFGDVYAASFCSSAYEYQDNDDVMSPVSGTYDKDRVRIIVLDPGHQECGMSEKEPNGPGSSTLKAKVSSGTSGVASGKKEYQLNLEIGLKLKDELEKRGYNVVMTRESNEVQISNSERAQIANANNADAFVRIHANGSDDTSVSGAMTICQTANNPYNSEYYSDSRRLSECILNAYVESTGFKKQYVWETDTMTGINWATVPSTIIELGYMTNPEEDVNMSLEEYQQLMVIGIANGIDDFLR